MKEVLLRVQKAIQEGSQANYSFVTDIQDDVMIITELNGIALPIALTVDMENNVIIAQSSLFHKASLTEVEKNTLNEAILDSNLETPLSNVATSNGVYVMVGELSVDSKDSVIFEEIECLATNSWDFASSIKSELLDKVSA